MKARGIASVGRWLLAAAWVFCAGAAAVRAGDPEKGGAPDQGDGYDLFHPVPADKLRDFNPDRPSLYTSPQTVDAGHFQLEMDAVNYVYDRHNPEHASVDVDQWNPAPFNLRIGLTKGTELDILYDGYINLRTRDRDAGTTRTQSGFGDVTLQYKYNFFGNDGGKFAFGVIPYVKLPANTAGLGNRYVEGGVLLPLSIDLGHNFEAGLETEFDALRNDADTRYEVAFTNIAFLGYNFLDKKFQVYGEFYSQVNQGPDSQVAATVNGGLLYFIGKNAEVDIGCNFGVTRAAPDFMPFTGFSVRF